MDIKQSKTLRILLRWLDDFPCDAIISSMSGRNVHIRVDSSVMTKLNEGSIYVEEENKVARKRRVEAKK